jgi:ATP-dependent Clp protease adaptor protein ClpS
MKLLPPYKVILHNDEKHSAGYVTDALVKVIPNLSTQEAWQIMLTAHTTGNAIVVIRPKEVAEYYQECLQGFDLTITIEPD